MSKIGASEAEIDGLHARVIFHWRLLRDAVLLLLKIARRLLH